MRQQLVSIHQRILPPGPAHAPPAHQRKAVPTGLVLLEVLPSQVRAVQELQAVPTVDRAVLLQAEVPTVVRAVRPAGVVALIVVRAVHPAGAVVLTVVRAVLPAEVAAPTAVRALRLREAVVLPVEVLPAEVPVVLVDNHSHVVVHTYINCQFFG